MFKNSIKKKCLKIQKKKERKKKNKKRFIFVVF